MNETEIFKTYIEVNQYIKQQNYDEAVKLLDDIRKASPQSPYLIYNYKLIAIYYQNNDVQKGKDLCKILVNSGIADAFIFIIYGLILYGLGDNNNALQVYKDGLKNNKEGDEIQHKYLYCNISLVYMDQGDYENALKYQQLGFESSEKFQPGKSSLAYSLKGKILSKQEKYQESLLFFNKAIEIDFENPTYFIDRAKVNYELNKKQEAFDDMKKAMRLIDQGKTGESGKKFIDYAKVIIKTFIDINERDKIIQLRIDNLQKEKQLNGEDSEKMKDALQRFNTIQLNREDITKKVFSKINNQKNKAEKQSLKEELKIYQEQIQMLESILQIPTKGQKKENLVEGQQDKEDIKNKFMDMENNNPQLFEYCKSFYWTLINCLNAYKSADKGVSQNKTQNQIDKESIFMEGSKNLVKLGEELTKGLPLLGNIIGKIDNLIDNILATKERQFENKVNSISKVIIFNQDSTFIFEENLSLSVAQLALKIVENQFKQQQIMKTLILNDKNNQKSAIEKGEEWLEKQIQTIQQDALNQGINFYDTRQSQLALQDVILLLSFIVKNHKSMLLNKETSLPDQFFNTVITDKSHDLLESACITESDSKTEEENSKKQVTKTTKEEGKSSKCCTIF